MPRALLIVESPAKAKTLERYLGADFKVYASYGHVRDLLSRTGAVDTDSDFSMRYAPVEKNQKHVNAIVSALRRADSLYLATDPDREGEAISWHLCELLQKQGALEKKQISRVVFHEITKRAVQEAIENPRELSYALVDAQQARRALDHLVGFNLSPLLWRKVAAGLSAGRVQSPALRLIVEREAEIIAFQAREYWSIEAELNHSEGVIQATLRVLEGKPLARYGIGSGAQADTIKTRLQGLASGQLQVHEVRRSQRRRRPAPPFITSTLQQEAVRKLGFSAQRTMRLAQTLYEGIDTGDGAVGLISYMRTDSVHLASEAVQEMRDYLRAQYGDEYVPEKPRLHKTRSRNAQEAHEAIRPTAIHRTPTSLKGHLSTDLFRLYDLIWKRAIASQMQDALIAMVSVDFACGGPDDLFRATGSSIIKEGFMRVYLEGRDDASDEETKSRNLPLMTKGDHLSLRQLSACQHFTEPPPRFTEASLVKTLEGHGIGRPSTYASIIQTLVQRKYVELTQKRFMPTDMGRIVSTFLSEHFADYVDYEFTARIEEDLDAIARGEKQRIPILQDFWDKFSRQIEDKEEKVTRSQAVQARELGIDFKTGKPVSVRVGRFGPFAQLGTRDDEEKPRFASLLPGQSVQTICFEEALKLFELPRPLGETLEGEPVSTGIGRFGPYVRYGSKYVSLTEGDDPYTLTLERALTCIAEKKRADAEREIQVFAAEGISVLNGRYGPYVTDGKKNANIPDDQDPATLSLSVCRELLTKPSSRRRKTAVGGKKKAKKKVATGRKVTRKKAKKKVATGRKVTRKKAKKKAIQTTGKTGKSFTDVETP